MAHRVTVFGLGCCSPHVNFRSGQSSNPGAGTPVEVHSSLSLSLSSPTLSLSTSSASLFQLRRLVARPRACRRRRYLSPLFFHLLFALLPDPSSSTDMLSDLRQRLSPVKCAAREVLRLRRGRCFVDSRRGSSWWFRLRSVPWKGRLLGFGAGPFSVSRSASGEIMQTW